LVRCGFTVKLECWLFVFIFVVNLFDMSNCLYLLSKASDFLYLSWIKVFQIMGHLGDVLFGGVLPPVS